MSEYEDWYTTAILSGIDANVIAYVNEYRYRITDYDIWENISVIMQSDTPDEHKQMLLKLSLDTQDVIMFWACYQRADHIFNPNDVLDGKFDKTVANCTRLQANANTYNLCYALHDRFQAYERGEITAEKFKHSYENFFGMLHEYFIPEMVILAARTAMAILRIPADCCISSNQFRKFADGYADLMFA